MAQAPKLDAEDPALPPSLRFLKALVIVLMLCMIGGVIAVTALLVTRLSAGGARVDLPEALAMPVGEVAVSVVPGPDWIGVVTASDRILIFNHDGGLRQEIEIRPVP